MRSIPQVSLPFSQTAGAKELASTITPTTPHPRWFEFEDPPEASSIPIAHPSIVPKDSSGPQTTAKLPRERDLFWRFEFELTVGGDTSLPIKGFRKMKFHGDPSSPLKNGDFSNISL
jgi:hypothetical protein